MSVDENWVHDFTNWWTCVDCQVLLFNAEADMPTGEGPWTCPKCGEVWS